MDRLLSLSACGEDGGGRQCLHRQDDDDNNDDYDVAMAWHVCLAASRNLSKPHRGNNNNIYHFER